MGRTRNNDSGDQVSETTYKIYVMCKVFSLRREQLMEIEASQERPSAIVTCVGGGGLATGKKKNTRWNLRFCSNAPKPCAHSRIDLGYEVSRMERRAASYGGNCRRRLFPQVFEGRSHCEDRSHHEVPTYLLCHTAL